MAVRHPDNFRAKAYRAEGRLKKDERYRCDDPTGFVERVTREDWFVYFFGQQTVQVAYHRNRTKRATTSYDPPTIHLSDDPSSWMWNQVVLLHELAHAVTPSSFPGHGLEWAQRYILLVAYELGFETAWALMDEFDRTNARYHVDPEIKAYDVQRTVRWAQEHDFGYWVPARVTFHDGSSRYLKVRHLDDDNRLVVEGAGPDTPELVNLTDVAYLTPIRK